MTWGMLLREGQQMLRPAFQDESEGEVRQEARYLLSWASGRSTAWLLARMNEPMTTDAHAATDAHVATDRFREALSRRVHREPVAYIIGQAGFCGHIFEVNPSVLIPRPDTELLVAAVSAFLHNRDMGLNEKARSSNQDNFASVSEDMARPPCQGNLAGNSIEMARPPCPGNLAGNSIKMARSCNKDNFTEPLHFTRILEIGTGSGCISCSLAMNHENARITAVDLSAEALCVAQSNADRLGVSGRIRFQRADVLTGSSSSFLNSNPAEQSLPTDVPISDPPAVSYGAVPERAPPTDAPISDPPISDPPAVLSVAIPEPNALYDVLVSNPPYIPSADLAGLMPDVLQYEPHIALDGGADGLLFYRRLLQISKDLLKCGGLLAVEIGHDQGVTVPDLFREERFSPSVYSDWGGNPRVVAGIFNGPNPAANK